MRAYTVEQTSVNFKWAFQRMLPSLPGPGTPAFADLCKGLHPYGLTPSAVTVDSPTTRLGDLYIGIVLLDNGRLTLRLACSGLDFFLKELFTGDEEILVRIVDLMFVALGSIDVDAIQGKANIRTSSHLKLLPGECEAMLREHTKLESAPSLIPDAVVYKVDLGSDSKAKELRVVIAKSLVYPDAIFLEINADYEGPFYAATVAEQVQIDSERITELLGLTEQVTLLDK